MQAYGVVTVLDHALDLPVPHDDRLHGLSKGCLERACKSEFELKNSSKAPLCMGPCWFALHEGGSCGLCNHLKF